MKLGICGGPERLSAAKELGYDYFETAASLIAAMSEEEFAALAAANEAVKDERFAGILACNGLFPGTLALVGEKADPAEAERYLNKLIPRLQKLGVQKLVFGSGGARRCPEGYEPDAALTQLRAVARAAVGLCDAAGIRLGMEHLNHNETNNLNTFAETVEFARATGSATLGVTLDFFHLGVESEPLSVLAPNVGRIAHCHTAAPDRGSVRPEDVPILTEQVKTLMAAGYDSTLSVEAGFRDFAEDGKVYLQVLRAAVN